MILLACLNNYCEVAPKDMWQPHWPSSLNSWPKRICCFLDLAVSIWNFHLYLPLTKEDDKLCFQFLQIPTQVILQFVTMSHFAKKKVSSVSIICHGVSVVRVSIACHLWMLKFEICWNISSNSFWYNWEPSFVNG